MEILRDEPDRFRLFVELWAYAQRDPRVRERLATEVEDLRALFASFARAGAADSGLAPDPAADRQAANVFVALSLGIGMTRLLDEDAVPAELLGRALSLVIRALESDPQARAQLTEPERARVADGA
jgi:hypothetical protein